MRLDLVLASACCLKKAKARALIDTGAVTIDGVVCAAYGYVSSPKPHLPWHNYIQ